VTGRDPVTQYKLEYHDSLPTTVAWTQLSSADVVEFSHNVESPFPANINQSDYFVKYRISAINGVGQGATTEIQVLTKTFPRKMDIVTFDEPTPSSVVIKWT
jgi:uncharacterized protein YktA (UPF0223 family)